MEKFKRHIAVILAVMMTLIFIPTVSFAADTAADIKYTVDSGDEVDFNESDFNSVCKKLNGEKLDYVQFDPPSSSKGVLYCDYDTRDQEKVDDSDRYYYGDDPSIDDITFVPKSGYTGTVTISYEGVDRDDNEFTGEIKITVSGSGSDSDTITYSVKTNHTVDFEEDDFDDACQDANDEELDYVTFTLPSSTKGVLYLDYEDDGDYGSKVKASTEYYYDENPEIGDITFVPYKNYSGTVTISYKGYDVEGDSFKGTVKITVKSSSSSSSDSDDIEYSVKAGGKINFDEDDFNDYCEDENDETLRYITFSIPSASMGVLWYDYDKRDQEKISSSDKFYYDDDPSIDDITFVASSSFSGDCTISFKGYDEEGDSITGYVVITGPEKVDTPVSYANAASIYFSDVKGDYYGWAVLYVDALYSAGVVKGTAGADNKQYFYPESKITRGDFMVLLYRALNISPNTTAGNFKDVASGSYYYDAIASAKALGIAQGSDNKFYPSATITREDAMVLAQRAMSITGNSAGVGSASDLYVYTDNASVSSYARDAIAALIKGGIITGDTDGKLYPKDSIIRAEAAAIIYRIRY